MPDIKTYALMQGNAHQLGFTVELSNTGPEHEMCVAKITPYVRNIVYDEVRYRHTWVVYFAVDFKMIHASKELLPYTTGTSVTMYKNVWTPWGTPYSVTIPNDGQPHYVGIRLECANTTPWYGPLKDYLYFEIQTNKYTVTPAVPKNTSTVFDENTRELTYHWDDADCKHVLLYRNWFDENDNVIKSGFFTIGDRSELLNSDIHDGLVTETIPENIVKITYEVINVSITDHTSTSGTLIADVPTDCKVWIKLPDGSWKKATPWIKLPDGSWKKVTKVYTKVDSVWKRTIM